MSYKMTFLANLCLAAVLLGVTSTYAEDSGNVTRSTHGPLPAVLLPNMTTTDTAVDSTKINSTETDVDHSTLSTEAVDHTESTTASQPSHRSANVSRDATADATHRPATTAIPAHSAEHDSSISTPAHVQDETSTTEASHSSTSAHHPPSHGATSSHLPEHQSTDHSSSHSTDHSSSHSTDHSSHSTSHESVSAEHVYYEYSWWKIVVALTIFCGMAGIILLILKVTESNACKKSKIKDEDLSNIEDGSDTTLNEKISTSRV